MRAPRSTSVSHMAVLVSSSGPNVDGCAQGSRPMIVRRRGVASVHVRAEVHCDQDQSSSSARTPATISPRSSSRSLKRTRAAAFFSSGRA